MKQILFILALGLVGCGPKGLQPCSDKQEVKEIITGVKQGCSGSGGIIVGAISSEEAEDLLDGTFTLDNENIINVVSIKHKNFFSINVVEVGEKLRVLAFKGELRNEDFSLFYEISDNEFEIRVEGEEIMTYIRRLPGLNTQDIILENIEIFNTKEDLIKELKRSQEW